MKRVERLSHALLETQSALHALHETQNALQETLNYLRLTRTVNRLQETILALVAPFVGVLLRFNVCKYPDYLVVFGTSPYIRFLFFCFFLFRLNPVLSLIRCELVAPTEPKK